MYSVRTILTPVLAFAVLLAPVMCCCTGAMALASAEVAQADTDTQTSPCGHCPESSDSESNESEQDGAPGHSDDCECEKTLIAPVQTLETKISAPAELPPLILAKSAPACLGYSQDFPMSSWFSGEPPGHALRTRLSLLCVLRI